MSAMSDNFTYLVDPVVSLAEAPAAAQRMIAWLQARGIVGAATRVGDLYRDWSTTWGLKESDLTAIDRTGYPPGPLYANACDARANLPPSIPNWLEVDVERRIFDAGGNGLEIFCPACNAEQTALGAAWGDAFSDWFEGDDAAPLVCGACGHRQPVTQWRYDPPWAFGHLGFNFQNWLLSDAFIAEFTAAYGQPLTVVHQHI
ncbi:hypothetical protein WK86_33110 [Burkholderia cepacia]|nr:hypothetical protein WK83_11550 [Burkholderia cepacia]KVV73808.1 hypothetical protein WK86_33110 [Burkholderia cepacia]KVV83566.1 hypothetical protein WK88_31805 [Burkholderia cepacia]KVV95355.1 hypothetical protein WK89_28800 [Burkholderia cepacia]KVW47442.1 hypothetical protein WK97_31645 [Burkholderia cepacia]